MSNKNEVFEYLVDQLRQHVNKKVVTSFNVSVRISDLDEVKQVIHNLQQLPVVDVMGEIKRWSIDRSIAGRGIYTDEENAIIDAYIGLEHNPYKQQCEDLAHEVQSLKNQLRDASAQIKELHLALVTATGDVEAYKLARKGEYGPEQSGCRKEDAQESCWIEWFGGYCPVPRGTLVDVTYRDGKTLNCLPADEIHYTARDASGSFWQHEDAPNDIVRYRRTTNQ